MNYYARQCSATREGMDEGWYAENDVLYFKYKEDVLKYVATLGYNSIDDAYDDELIYYTSWNDDDWRYVEIKGELYDIETLDSPIQHLVRENMMMQSILDDISYNLAAYQNQKGIGTMDDVQWGDLFIERVAASISSYETKNENNENN